MRERMRGKATLLKTTEDFSERTSIHGIGYVFDRNLNLLDRLLWLVFVLAFLGLATGLTWNTWTQWREEQVVTPLKKTAKPVTELPFPAVTICGSGFHMNNVEKQVTEDFAAWRRDNRKDEIDPDRIKEDITDFMRVTFQIMQDDNNASEHNGHSGHDGGIKR